MKTAHLDVADLLSPLGARGIEKQLASLAGVHHAAMNPASASVTVHYDETQTDVAQLAAAIWRRRF